MRMQMSMQMNIDINMFYFIIINPVEVYLNR